MTLSGILSAEVEKRLMNAAALGMDICWSSKARGLAIEIHVSNLFTSKHIHVVF